MAESDAALVAGAARTVRAVLGWRATVDGAVVVAIDGHGASGKTTLAEAVAGRLDAALVHTDDFYRDAGPAVVGMAPMAPMARYYDWARMRQEGIMPALGSAGPGSVGPGRSEVAPGVVLIEGVSSASPALADLVTHRVLVMTPEPVRLARLRARISPQEWDEAWLAEERVYFTSRPATGFDLVVAGVG